MIYVDFCRNRNNNLWIGCAEYQNGKYFATGRTLDTLMKNIKTGGSRIFKISGSNFMLASYQMEEGEFEQKYYIYMSKLFRTRYWNTKIEKEQTEIHEEIKPNVDPFIEAAKTLGVSTTPTKSEFVCEEKDGEMIVYELRVYARYKLHKNNLTTTNKGVTNDF